MAEASYKEVSAYKSCPATRIVVHKNCFGMIHFWSLQFILCLVSMCEGEKRKLVIPSDLGKLLLQKVARCSKAIFSAGFANLHSPNWAIKQRTECSNYCRGFICILQLLQHVSSGLVVQWLDWHDSCSDKIYIHHLECSLSCIFGVW